MRDESLHCEGIIKLYHAFNKETGAVTKAVADDIVDCCKTVVGLEDKFIDLAFEVGAVQGMTPDDIKPTSASSPTGACASCSLPEVYGVKENPLPWLQSHAVGRRARQLLRGPRHRILQGRHHAAHWHGADGVWGSFDAMLKRRETAEG